MSSQALVFFIQFYYTLFHSSTFFILWWMFSLQCAIFFSSARHGLELSFIFSRLPSCTYALNLCTWRQCFITCGNEEAMDSLFPKVYSNQVPYFLNKTRSLGRVRCQVSHTFCTLYLFTSLELLPIEVNCFALQNKFEWNYRKVLVISTHSG